MSSTKTKTTTQEGPSSTSTTTTKTFRTSTEDSHVPAYRSRQGRRTTVINRSTVGPSRAGGVSQSSSYSNYSSMPMVSAQSYGNVANMGIATVKEGRHQEKKDMQDLNERLASYVEKVRFLEAQNRKLADELDKLKSKWGKETSAVKAMYQTELDESRRLLDDAEKGKAGAEVNMHSMEDVIVELEERVQRLEQDLLQEKDVTGKQQRQLSDYESEINLLRRRNETLESEKERDKQDIARHNDTVKALRCDLDCETLNHIDADNRRQTLDEEIEFLKQIHEQELKELAALTYRDTTSENREFWKNEMGQCLREIQATYDEKLTAMRIDTETTYNNRMQEFRTGATRSSMETTNAKEESKKMRSALSDARAKLSDLEGQNALLQAQMRELKRNYEEEISELRAELDQSRSQNLSFKAELDALLSEMQGLIDSKMGLELEIAAYRKLLEGEENRVGLKNVVDSMLSSGFVAQEPKKDDDSKHRVSQVVKGEMQAKTTYQRSAKGAVSISDCSGDGGVITIENNGRRDESIGDWTLRRVVDGKEKVNFTFASGLSMRVGMKRRIYTGLYEGDIGPNDIDTGLEEFYIGSVITTKLVNSNKEEKATHVQRTTYNS